MWALSLLAKDEPVPLHQQTRVLTTGDGPAPASLADLSLNH